MSALLERDLYREKVRYETLDGKIYAMSPSPRINHNRVIGNIFTAFKRQLRGKECEVFCDGTDVFLTKKDTVIPDVFVVCNPDIVKFDGIYGTPELMVEVLSNSTKRRDKGYKFRLYERCGVKEYWIVDTEWERGAYIEVYVLNEEEKRFELHDVYGAYYAHEVEIMKPEERENLIFSFNSQIFPEMEFELSEIFERIV